MHWERRLLRGAGHGLLAFLLAALLESPLLGSGPLPIMLLAGAVAGILMNLKVPSRPRCAAIGGAAYLVGVLATMTITGHSLAAILAQAPRILCRAAIAACACGLVGLDREARRAGGC